MAFQPDSTRKHPIEMKDYSWSELSKIYEACVALPLKKQEAYIISQAKNNTSLRDRLLHMLNSNDEADEFFNQLHKGVADGLIFESEDLLQSGDLVGSYEIKKRVGSGGSSQVYIGTRNDGQFSKEVAIKIFKKSDGNGENPALQNEKDFLASLSHPSLPQIFDAGNLSTGNPYIVMELVEGKILNQYLSSNELPLKNRILLFREILKAIEYAHNNLILHLDIKPSNIIITEEGAVKLIDFGISKSLNNASYVPTENKLTLSFAAPEQLHRQPVSTKTDIYQLGLLLVYLVEQTTLDTRIDRSSIDEVKALTNRIAGKELRSIVLKCIQPKPEDRYISVQSLRHDLDDYLNGYPVNAYSISALYKASKFLARNKYIVTLSFLLFISLALGIIYTVNEQRLAEAKETEAKEINSFLIALFNNANAENSADPITVAQILKKSTIYLEQTEKGVNLAVLRTLIELLESHFLFEEAKKMVHKILAEKELTKSQELTLIASLAQIENELNNFTVSDSLFQIAVSDIQELGKVEQVNLYANYAKLFQRTAKYDSAILMLERARKVADNSILLADLLNRSSAVYREKSSYDTALYLNKKAEDILTLKTPSGGNKEKVKVYNNQGIIYSKLSLYDSAISSYKNALYYAIEVDGKRTINHATTLANLGGTYYKLKRYDSALKFYDEALVLLRQKFDETNGTIVSVQYNIANISMSAKSFQKAIVMYKKVLAADISTYSSTHPYVGDDFSNLAKCYLHLEKMDSSWQYLDSAKSIFTQNFDSTHQKIAYLNSLYGQYFENAEEFQKSIAYYQIAYDLSLKYLGEEHAYTKSYQDEIKIIGRRLKK